MGTGGQNRTGQDKKRKVCPASTVLSFALSSFPSSVSPDVQVLEKGLLEWGEMGLLPREWGKNTNFSRRLTQFQVLELPGCQQPTASKSELNEFGTALLVIFGGWGGQIIPNLLLYPFRIHRRRGQNEEEEFSFLIWGQDWEKQQLFIIKAGIVKYSFKCLSPFQKVRISLIYYSFWSPRWNSFMQLQIIRPRHSLKGTLSNQMQLFLHPDMWLLCWISWRKGREGAGRNLGGWPVPICP